MLIVSRAWRKARTSLFRIYLRVASLQSPDQGPPPSASRTINTRPLAFLHIPKTAGASTIQILDNFFDYGEIALAYNAPDFEVVPTGKRLYRGHMNADIQKRRFPDAECFTIGREPTALMRSMYHWMREPLDWAAQVERVAKIGSNDEALRASTSHARMAASRLSFSEAIRSNETSVRQRLIAIYPRILTDSRFVPDVQKLDQIALAEAWIDACCAVGTMEDLETAIHRLCEHRNWPAPARLPTTHMRKKPKSTDGEEEARRIAAETGDTALYERIRTRAEAENAALLQRAGGRNHVRSYLNERHAAFFFAHAPRETWSDYSAWHFWPGFDWGFRAVVGDMLATRAFGEEGRGTLLAKVEPCTDHEVYLTVRAAPWRKAEGDIRAEVGGAELASRSNARTLSGRHLVWHLPAEIVGDGDLRISFATGADPARIALERIGIRQQPSA